MCSKSDKKLTKKERDKDLEKKEAEKKGIYRNCSAGFASPETLKFIRERMREKEKERVKGRMKE